MRSARILLLLFLLLVGLWGSQPRAEVEMQLQGDDVANITRLFQRYHLSRDPFDKVHSEQMLEAYLNQLDPGHYYFLQSDINEFDRSRDALGDQIRDGNIDVAYRVEKRLLQRMKERQPAILADLSKPIDLTANDTLQVDRKDAPYPQDDQEADDLWAKRLKFELAEHLATGETDASARDFLRHRYQGALLRMQETTHNEVVTQYLDAFTASYDPHSSYLSPDELENFNISLRLSLEGIGATLRWDDGYTIISSIIPGGAAARDGTLKTEDKIIAVAQGKDGPFEDVRNMRLIDVVKLIRGKRNSIVRLACLRKAEGIRETRFEVSIARDRIVLTDREAKGTVEDVKRPDRAAPYRIGVIDLPSFYVDFSQRQSNPERYKSSSRDVERILERFNSQGVDAVVLDLRDNGGGGLDEAVSLSGLFLNPGAIVRVRDYNGDVTTYDNPHDAPVYSGPLLVLINRFSASASEILAGAMQDYGRALIVGDRTTFGKGTVQNIINLPMGQGALKITVAKFYRPGGSSTQNRGVEADIVLPSLNNYLDVGESSLPHALPWDSLPRTPLKTWGDPEALLPALTVRSHQRTGTIAAFQKVNEQIQTYLKNQKGKKDVTLKDVMAEGKAASITAKLDTSAGRPETNKKAPGSDQGLTEAENILLDAMQLSGKGDSSRVVERRAS